MLRRVVYSVRLHGRRVCKGRRQKSLEMAADAEEAWLMGQRLL